MSPVVPSNKLQSRLRNHEFAHGSPGTGTRHTAVGKLVEVYDGEKQGLLALPADIVSQIEQTPGLLFAKVQLPSGAQIVLPFKEPEDQVYLTYGNAAMLEGRSVKIEFDAMSIESGQIMLQRSWASKQLNIPQVSSIYDIGALI